jgi:hypothetical protein
MPDLPDELLSQLLDLIDTLRRETDGFLEDAGDRQLWYNRGYANGMVLALLRLGQSGPLAHRLADDLGQLDAHFTMPWGKAYRHGESTGCRETHEITGTESP